MAKEERGNKMNYWVHQIGMLSLFFGLMFIPLGLILGFTFEYIQIALLTTVFGSLILFFITGEFEPMFKRIRQYSKNEGEKEKDKVF